jgi:hypothetical protein
MYQSGDVMAHFKGVSIYLEVVAQHASRQKEEAMLRRRLCRQQGPSQRRMAKKKRKRRSTSELTKTRASLNASFTSCHSRLESLMNLCDCV